MLLSGMDMQVVSFGGSATAIANAQATATVGGRRLLQLI